MDIDTASTPATVLEFEASVDGRRIGTHRFELDGDPASELRVHSLAEFAYRVLGVTVYRYRHEAREVWRQGCVASLESTTDDDGKKLAVKAARSEGELRVEGQRTLPGCVHAYAYWRPEWLAASQLLNPQTGASDAITITVLETAPLERLGGGSVPAQRRRISGDKLRIDLWYGTDGEWLQLESTTPENRVLKYRRIGTRKAQ